MTIKKLWRCLAPGCTLVLSACDAITFECKGDSDDIVSLCPDNAEDGLTPEIVDMAACDTGLPPEVCEADVRGMSSSDYNDENYIGFDNFKGVSIGTNTGLNYVSIRDMARLNEEFSESYLKWLNEIHANWVMVPVSVMYDGTAIPASVAVEHAPTNAPDDVEIVYTYTEAQLGKVISSLESSPHSELRTAISINLQSTVKDDATQCRWMLGKDAPDATEAEELDCSSNNINLWYWDASGAPEQAQIDAFWDSYISSVLTILQYSASDGATPDLIVLGTETDFLFRENVYWEPRIRQLMTAVRAETADWNPPPLLSVAYTEAVFTDPSNHPGTQGMFTNVLDDNGQSLDIIGLTGYFKFFEDDNANRFGPHSRCTYENAWTKAIHNIGEYWVADAKPVVLMELGVPNTTEAPFDPAMDNGDTPREPEQDLEGERPLEDGDETQRNDLHGYFRARNECNDIVLGQFLWDNPVADESDWNGVMRESRSHGVRRWTADNGVENVDHANNLVAAAYDDTTWAPMQAPPDAPTDSALLDTAPSQATSVPR